MLSTFEVNRIMSEGLSGESTQANNELNRLIVALNNYLWRVDQLLWTREDEQAVKFLQRANKISLRMEPIPLEVAKELRIRTKLLSDRAQLFPVLLSNPTPSALQMWTKTTMPRFGLEIVSLLRHQAFGNDFYFEDDGWDEESSFCVAFYGDEMVGGVRFRECTLPVGFPVLWLDQVFVTQDCRLQKCATRLFACVAQESKRTQLPLFLGLKRSWKLYGLFADKLVRSRYRVCNEGMFVPNLDAVGGSVFTVFEPVFNVM